MDKLAGDLINQLDTLDLATSSFDFFVEIRKSNDNGGNEHTIKAIDSIDVIEEERECLLLICPHDEPIEISSEIRNQIKNIPENYTVYACYEINLDGGLAKVKIPVNGFKEDSERSKFYAVCGLNK